MVASVKNRFNRAVERDFQPLTSALGCRALAIALSSFLHASALVLAADGRLQTSFSSIAASSNSGAAAIRRAFALSTGLPFIVPTVQIRRGPVSGVPIERTAGWCAVGCSIHGPGVCFVSIFHSFILV